MSGRGTGRLMPYAERWEGHVRDRFAMFATLQERVGQVCQSVRLACHDDVTRAREQARARRPEPTRRDNDE